MSDNSVVSKSAFDKMHELYEQAEEDFGEALNLLDDLMNDPSMPADLAERIKVYLND